MPTPIDDDAQPRGGFWAEAEKVASSENRGLEDGLDRRRAMAGRIVQTRGAEYPFKVVIDHEDGATTEHVCTLMQEGEEMIRRTLPIAVLRDRSRDRESGQA